jgi:RND superfamily putative drug exporter
VIAALLCLMLAKVNGTAGLGPIAAIGIACAALSMLTLLPALLTIFGRRAFWPFVPHTPETAPDGGAVSERARGAIVEGGAVGALARVVLAALLVLVLLPLVLLNWLLRRLSGRRIPSLIVGPLGRAVFTPYEVRRHRLEHAADATHGFWKRVGDRVAAGPRRVMLGAIAVLLIFCGGFAFFSTDLTAEDSYTTEVESVEGQKLLSKSFPNGATALTDIVVPQASEVPAVRRSVASVADVEDVSGPVKSGPPGTLVQATLGIEPYSTEAFDLVEPIREAAHGASPGALVGGPTAIEFDVRDSVPLMFSKTSIASAEKPAPPVTLTSSPGGGSAMSARQASTGSRIRSPSPSALMSAVTIAALPSGETTGWPKAPPPSSTTAGNSALVSFSAAISRLMWARSAAVRPEARR